MEIEEIKKKIREKSYEISYHAEVKKGKRKISMQEVAQAILSGKIIEDYPQDPRGPSCLILGYTSQHKPLHIVCSILQSGILRIVTVYFPDEERWVGFEKRKGGTDET